MKLQPYNNSILCHWETRSPYFRWFQELIARGFFDQQLVFFSDTTWIMVYINGSINRITDIDVFKIPKSLH
jgi:hypothetical protein